MLAWNNYGIKNDNDDDDDDDEVYILYYSPIFILRIFDFISFQKKLPVEGWDDLSIEHLLHDIAVMDSNNFSGNLLSFLIILKYMYLLSLVVGQCGGIVLFVCCLGHCRMLLISVSVCCWIGSFSIFKLLFYRIIIQ